MRWSLAVIVMMAVIVLGCTTQIPILGGIDYSGAYDSSVVEDFLGQGIVNSEGVLMEYKPEIGDDYNVSLGSCSDSRCVININLSVYYISFYDKFFEIEATADYASDSWSITDYSIVSETTIRRDI